MIGGIGLARYLDQDKDAEKFAPMPRLAWSRAYRSGDLVRLKTDLFSVFDSIHRGTLRNVKVGWSEGASACVVAANKGYPGKYETGAIIEGLNEVDHERVHVFHAGTSLNGDGRLIATGGRVLGVTAAAADLSSALDLCYESLRKIRWRGIQFRRDIGRQASLKGAFWRALNTTDILQ